MAKTLARIVLAGRVLPILRHPIAIFGCDASPSKRDFSVPWASFQSAGQSCLSHGRTAFILGCLAVFGMAEMAAAQTTSQDAIAVVCTGADRVPAQTLSWLCADLHRILDAAYPDARFELAVGPPATDAISVSFEAFAASASLLEARLTLHRPGSHRVEGPRMGFAASDKAMTPDQKLQFLDRLVTETDFPL